MRESGCQLPTGEMQFRAFRIRGNQFDCGGLALGLSPVGEINGAAVCAAQVPVQIKGPIDNHPLPLCPARSDCFLAHGSLPANKIALCCGGAIDSHGAKVMAPKWMSRPAQHRTPVIRYPR